MPFRKLKFLLNLLHFFDPPQKKEIFCVLIFMESYFDPLMGELDPNLEWVKNGKKWIIFKKINLERAARDRFDPFKRVNSDFFKQVLLKMIENLTYSR